MEVLEELLLELLVPLRKELFKQWSKDGAAAAAAEEEVVAPAAVPAAAASDCVFKTQMLTLHKKVFQLSILVLLVLAIFVCEEGSS